MELIQIIGAILLHRPDAPPMITSSEIGCEIIQLLHPFKRLTEEICAQHFITKLQFEITKRFHKLEHYSSLDIATALDPLFKRI